MKLDFDVTRAYNTSTHTCSYMHTHQEYNKDLAHTNTQSLSYARHTRTYTHVCLRVCMQDYHTLYIYKFSHQNTQETAWQKVVTESERGSNLGQDISLPQMVLDSWVFHSGQQMRAPDLHDNECCYCDAISLGILRFHKHRFIRHSQTKKFIPRGKRRGYITCIQNVRLYTWL